MLGSNFKIEYEAGEAAKAKEETRRQAREVERLREEVRLRNLSLKISTQNPRPET